jgi:hypothetical protein
MRCGPALQLLADAFLAHFLGTQVAKKVAGHREAPGELPTDQKWKRQSFSQSIEMVKKSNS